ncbi:MAG: rRNA maturation RNase YbeY [Gammaproteobacteria bacterium]|nr:rRNA maturation RNase YbeY [Gammaproteobacteria bacterium]
MYRILVQRATRKTFAPAAPLLKKWATSALRQLISSAELTIRIVNEKEMLALNSNYRHKHYATNVLSFPFEIPSDVQMDIPLLGDIVICAAVVNAEADTQHKTVEAHWAHMIVHGVLHLLGYDHENETDAVKMETEEIRILQTLNFSNPYEIIKE